MPDLGSTLMPARNRALLCAALAIGMCAVIVAQGRCLSASPQTTRSQTHSSPQPPAIVEASRWQQLDLALSDLAPDSQRARNLVPDLIDAAKHPETPDVLRQRSILMLGRIGEPAATAIPVFLELLHEYREAESPAAALSNSTATVTVIQAIERRVWLLESLGDFDEAANDAVPVLRRDLFDRSRPVDDRVQIADVLGQIGTVSAVSALADALRQWPPGTPPAEQIVKRTIVDCIGLSGPAGIVGLPALLRTIEDEDSSVRRKVCEAITLFGPAGELATDALVERLILDEVPAVQDAAADTLAAIGPTTVPDLIRLLKSNEPDLQWRAARSLGKIGAAASDALPALEQLIRELRQSVEDVEGQVRIEAFEAHWQISNDATGIFQELVSELGSDNRGSRRRACQLLANPARLPAPLKRRLVTLAQGRSQAAKDAAYVLRTRERISQER